MRTFAAALLALSGAIPDAETSSVAATATSSVGPTATSSRAVPWGSAVDKDREDGFDDTEEIVVTASRVAMPLSDAPVPTEVINFADIESSGARDLGELLEEHPGVQIDRGIRGTSIQVQGLDPEYTLVLVDGQRVVGRTDGVLDLSRFTTGQIQRVEIVKGAASALYGADALGGVINIITRPGGDELIAEGRVSYGSRNTTQTNATVGAGGEGWSSRVTGSFQHADAYDLSPDTPDTSGSAFDTASVDGRGRLALSEDASLDVHADYTYRALDGVDDYATGAVVDQKIRTNTASLRVQPDFRFDEHHVQLTAFGSWYRYQYAEDQRGGTALDRFSQTEELFGQLSAQYDATWFDDHQVAVGAESLFQHISADRLADGTSGRYRVALFAQDMWTLLDGPELVLTPGARIDVDSQFGAYPTPRIAVRFDPTRDLVLRASVGMGFRAPDFKQLYLRFENLGAGYRIDGNPDLNPETSVNVNLGFEAAVTEWLKVSVNGFHNRLRDLITERLVGETGVGDGIYTYVNVANARTQGVEGQLTLRPMRALSANLGYTLLDARDLDEDRRLDGRATHRVTFKVRASVPGWGLSGLVRAAWVSARPYYDLVEEVTNESDPYISLDARLNQDLGKHISLFLGGDNLLNVGDPVYQRQPPLTIYGGVDARL